MSMGRMRTMGQSSRQKSQAEGKKNRLKDHTRRLVILLNRASTDLLTPYSLFGLYYPFDFVLIPFPSSSSILAFYLSFLFFDFLVRLVVLLVKHPYVQTRTLSRQYISAFIDKIKTMGNTPSHPRSASSASNQNASSSSASSTNNHHISASSVVSSLTSRTIHKNRDRSTSAPPVLTPQQIIESEALIDGGHTVPMGLYQLAPQDFSQPVVKQLILDRKLSPFYTGLDDYDEDSQPEEVLKSLREARAAVETKRMQLKAADDEAAAAVSAVSPKEGPPTERESRELEWYQGASECPLCFLFYPPNINTSRCCDQPICTECFVQIKRAEATLTHLESEPACCPFCMEPNFGIVYNRPRPRITAPHHQSSLSTISAISAGAGDSSFSIDDGTSTPRREERIRRKSVGHTNSGVVTTDEIRSDWEAKLEAVKAVAARRANRRIVMRQVGDRLIPVGITSSRTPIAPLQLGDGDQAQSTNGRRGSRRMTGEMAMVGPDIEEIMMMEAMRLSLLEHEQHQARQANGEQNESQPSGPASRVSTSAEDPQSSSRAAPSSITNSLPPPLIPTLNSREERRREGDEESLL